MPRHNNRGTTNWYRRQIREKEAQKARVAAAYRFMAMAEAIGAKPKHNTTRKNNGKNNNGKKNGNNGTRKNGGNNNKK